MDKPIFVSFGNGTIERNFAKLSNSSSIEKNVQHSIKKTIEFLKKNPMVGIKIQKRLWPEKYIRLYALTNLWKCNLSNAYRLLYTIKENESIVLVVIMNWFSHKEYERVFGY